LQSEGFAVYENYCSKYDLLYEDMDIFRKTLSASAFFDQGIEALAKSVASTTSRRLEDRKCMTLKDLLIKVCQIFTMHSGIMLKSGCSQSSASANIRFYFKNF
jgi:hypothetical protein